MLLSGYNYEFEIPYYGLFEIKAKAAHWLMQKHMADLPIYEPVNFSLINGDINGDNRINVLDYIKLKKSYNKVGVENDPADLNGDNKVNVLDYSILKLNDNKLSE